MELWWAGPSPGRWRGGISSLAKSGKGERTGGCSLPPRLQEEKGEAGRETENLLQGGKDRQGHTEPWKADKKIWRASWRTSPEHGILA